MKKILSVLVLTIVMVVVLTSGNEVSAATTYNRTVYNCDRLYNIFGVQIGEICNKTRWDYNGEKVFYSEVFSTGWRSAGTFENLGTDKYMLYNDTEVQTSAEGKVCVGGTSWWNSLDCYQDENGVRAKATGSYYFNKKK